MKEHTVLERNLERLFERAYVPVRIAPEFRAGLTLAITRALAHPLPASRRPGERTAAGRAGAWRIAAAAVLLVGFGWLAWRATRPPEGATGPEGGDALLAAGTPAVRQPPGAWRPLTPHERARGVEFDAGAIELATPRPSAGTGGAGNTGPAGARLWIADDGSAQLEPASAVAARLDAHSAMLDLDFSRGALVLERLAAGGAWSVSTGQGRFQLVRGVLELAYVGPELLDGSQSLRARLTAGEAWFEGGGERVLLTLALAYVARDGRVELAASHVSSGHGAERFGRTPASSATPATAADPAAVAAPGTGTLVAELALPSGRTLSGPWSATLIPMLRLPEVGDPSTRELAADAHGFRWDDLEPGGYELFVDVAGFGAWRTNELVLGAGETLAIRVRLDSGASVHGRVVDASTGLPIHGAEVVSETDAPTPVLPFALSEEQAPGSGSWRAATRTRADGRFELEALSAGRHVFRACAPGRGAEWSAPIALTAGEFGPELAFRLAPGGGVAGTLCDDFGRARDGVYVIASRIDFAAPRRCISYGATETDAYGRFSVGDLAGGLYVLILVEDGKPNPRIVQVVVAAGEVTELDLCGNGAGGRLTGSVRHAGGQLADDVDISIQPADSEGRASFRNARTNANGHYVLHGIEPGRYELYAGRNIGSQLALVGTLELAGTGPYTHDVLLGAGVLAGTVRSAAAGTPQGGAFVLLMYATADGWEFGARATTDPEGRWNAEFLTPGRWRATAYAATEGLAPAESAVVEVLPLPPAAIGQPERSPTENAPMESRKDAESAQRIELELVRGASLDVRVIDVDDIPLRGVALRFEDALGKRWQFAQDERSDSNGRLRVPGLAAGEWNVRGSCEGFVSGAARIALDAGDDRELTLRLARAGENK